MRKSRIELLVHEHGGYFFDYGDDGFLLLNKTDKQILHLENMGKDEDQQVSDAINFLAHDNRPESNENDESLIKNKPCLFVDIKCCYVECSQILESILTSIVSFQEDHLVYLRIHFDESKSCWRDFFHSFIMACCDRFGNEWPVFHLCGPFTPVFDADKEFFLHNFHLFYVQDIVSENTPFSKADRQVVEEIAEYSFVCRFCGMSKRGTLASFPILLKKA